MPALNERQPIQREGRQRQRLDGQPQQEQRRVVACRTVRVELAAAGAAMDDHPFAAAADADGDRLHAGAALVEHGAVARPVVHVARPEAGGTVIAVLGAGRIGGNVEATVNAAERVLVATRPCATRMT